MDILIVVDMQNDFIDGSLGSIEAKSIVPNVIQKIKAFQGVVLFTKDTHQSDYLNTNEGKNLPVEHCIENTNGWQLHPDIESLRNTTCFNKSTFGSLELMNHLKNQTNLNSVTLIGLCTDICVISNAMLIKAAMPEIDIIVDQTCCAGVTTQSHLNALEAMKMCHIIIT